MRHFVFRSPSGIIEQMNRSKIGVIQALGLGFELVTRALWVILIPIALDFYFWLGPRLSVYPLFEGLIRSMANTGALAPEFQQNLDEVRLYLSEVGSSLNLFSLLATDFWGLRLLPIPTLKAFELPDVGDGSVIQASGSPLIPIDNVLAALLSALVLLAMGLLIGALYLTLIADRVRANEATLGPLPQRVLTYWLRLMLYVGSLLTFFALMSIPFMIVLGIASLIHYGLALLVMLSGWIASFWLLIYLLFVSYAIVIGNDNVLRALWNSTNVVQRNLLSTFSLVLLSNLIVMGMLTIWQRAEVSWLGNVIAIVANAFIGSGLVAAMFVFYQNRLQVWKEQGAGRQVQAAGRRL